MTARAYPVDHDAVQPETIARLVKEEQAAEAERDAAPPGPVGTRGAVEEYAAQWATAYTVQADRLAIQLAEAQEHAAFWQRIVAALPPGTP